VLDDDTDDFIYESLGRRKQFDGGRLSDG